MKALAQVFLACAPFAFKTNAKRSGDTDAVIQRVVWFLIRLWHFTQFLQGLQNTDTSLNIKCPLICRWWYLFVGGESSVTIQFLYVGKNSLSLHNMFCPGVTMKDADYQNKKAYVWTAT